MMFLISTVIIAIIYHRSIPMSAAEDPKKQALIGRMIIQNYTNTILKYDKVLNVLQMLVRCGSN